MEHRVACLLRVSTLKQARKHKDDEETLPVQREAVRRFVSSRRGWHLVPGCEYTEEGVSAYTNKAEDRSVLQQILMDARNKIFDTLVVFKYDRLSRQSIDYLVLIRDLKRMGVTVWTVADDGIGRELKLETMMDTALRFLEGWQAQSESLNTSIRVTAKMQDMAKQGIWTGGKPPYGFHLKGGGKAKNGGQDSLEIDEEESAVVVYIFNMYLDEGIGSTTIGRRLNDEGYRTRSGHKWGDTVVRQIINNPTVAGRLPYGRHYRDKDNGSWHRRPKGSKEIILGPENPALAIIPWERWLLAQERMAQWKPYRHSEPVEDHGHIRTKADAGPRLLTGLARCGYCGGPITSGWAAPVKELKDGTLARYRYPRYVDRNRYGGQRCEGQAGYSVKKLDNAVLFHVREQLEGMGSNVVYQRIRQQIAQGAFQQTQRLKIARKRESDAERFLEECTKRWKEWLIQSEEKRKYSEEFLTAQIAEAEKELKNARFERMQMERNGGDMETRLAHLDEFLKVAPKFWQTFLAADPGKQKQLLRHLLSKVVVYRDGIEIYWKVNLAEVMGQQTTLDTLAWQDKVEMA